MVYQAPICIHHAHTPSTCLRKCRGRGGRPEGWAAELFFVISMYEQPLVATLKQLPLLCCHRAALMQLQLFLQLD